MTRWTMVAGLLAAASLAGCNCGEEIAALPDGGAPVVDGALPASDGAVVGQDGSLPEVDGSVLETDGSVPEADGSMPAEDGSVPEVDGSWPPGPDASAPAADGSLPPGPDASAPAADGSLPPGPDASAPAADGSLPPGPDASAPAADGSLPPGPDASAPAADGSLPPGPDAGVNHAPTVSLPAAYSVVEGQALAMSATGSDPDGDTLTWSWAQTAGTPAVTLTGTSTPNAGFTAPAVAGTTVIEITVTVCDPAGLCASATTKVTIDRIPTITTAYATPSPVDEGQGCALTVTAVDSGDTLTYAWTQTAGPAVTLTGGSTANATFTAPLVSADTALTFSIKVCDSFGACATSSVTVTVLDVDAAPTAKATAAPNPADPFATVTLDASGSTDPEGGALTFDWAQTAGPAVALATPKTAKATFTAPLFQDDTVLTFEVEVCDGVPQCATASVSVTVLGYDTYVSATGSDAAPTQCTKAKPCRSIPVALGNAATYAYTTVRVDKGDYPGSFDMVTGVAVECGYDRAAAWARSGTLSRILTTNATGVRFGPKVDARLDACTVLFQQGLITIMKLATVTVEGAAVAALAGCSVDPTDASTIANSTTGVNVVGPAATLSVGGGTIVGGNGKTEAVGIGVAGASTLTVDAATLEGSPKGAPTDSFAVRVTDGLASLVAATVKAGNGQASATGVSATGANSTLLVSGCTVGGGAATQWTGVKMSGIKTGTVTGTTINGGSALSSSGGAWAYGVWVESTGTYLIDANPRVVGGTATTGAVGVYTVNSAVQIKSNAYLGGGTSAAEMNGVRVQGGNPTVTQNAAIEGGPATALGVGVRVNSGSVSITDNTAIVGAVASPTGLTPTGYGIYIPPASAGAGVSGIITGNPSVSGGNAKDLVVGLQMSLVSRMTVARNTLKGGQAQTAAWSLRDGAPGGGVPGNSTLLTIDNNLLEPSKAPGGPVILIAETGGAYFGFTSGSVTNNRIFAGPGTTSYGARGGGNLLFFHNYVTGGGAPGSIGGTTYAMYLQSNGKMGTYDNNILDTGRMAAKRYAFWEDLFFQPMEFAHNDFFPDAGGILYHTSSGFDLNTAASINGIGAQYFGNLDVDPLFQAPAAGDYHLQPTSPMIDKGYTSTQGPTTDMDGDKRPLVSGGVVDIGPDEAK